MDPVTKKDVEAYEAEIDAYLRTQRKALDRPPKPKPEKPTDRPVLR